MKSSSPSLLLLPTRERALKHTRFAGLSPPFRRSCVKRPVFSPERRAGYAGFRQQWHLTFRIQYSQKGAIFFNK